MSTSLHTNRQGLVAETVIGQLLRRQRGELQQGVWFGEQNVVVEVMKGTLRWSEQGWMLTLHLIEGGI